MDSARLAELLQPFTETALPASLIASLQLYLNLLLRWNARMNLTAVREPEQIVTRHFGESLFAGEVLKKNCQFSSERETTLVDVGSGAGFPGIPIKLLIPELQLTLIESQNKKATFLREVLRTLKLDGTEVFSGRAEQWPTTARIVTLRAVEQFARALPVGARLVADGGNLCLLIGSDQGSAVPQLLPGWKWAEPIAVPDSNARVVLLGQRAVRDETQRAP